MSTRPAAPRAGPLLLNADEVRALITPAQALVAVREAFRLLAAGRAVQPPSFDLDLPEVQGELHVKGAYLHGLPRFAIKAASGFYRNRALDLPVGSGLSLVFDAATGLLEAILLDGGWLTDLRTGAAAALAAELLAPAQVDTAGILGAGTQARFQLAALLEVRRPRRVLAWSRRAGAAHDYAAEMTRAHGVPVQALESAQAVVSQAQLVVTTTPARAPIVQADWVRPGTHITAMGSDLTGKQELEPALLGRADCVVADQKDNCLRSGEIGRAVAAGVLDPGNVIELGAIVAGRAPGRQRDDEITVADQCGLGICDTAVANAVVTAARARGAGVTLTP